MKKMLTLLAAFCLSTLCLEARGQRPLQSSSKTFNQKVGADIASGISRKDAGAVGLHLSRMYNEGGVSRDEAVRQMQQVFKNYRSLKAEYRVIDFKVFPAGNLASARTVTQITGVPTRGGAAQTVIQTAGYASLILEEGQWRIYATQPAGCPAISNFGADVERGDWSGWGSQVNIAAFAPEGAGPAGVQFAQFAAPGGEAQGALASSAMSFAPASAGQGDRRAAGFDKNAWERGFTDAWNSRNAAQVMSYYSKLYSEFGADHAEISKRVAETIRTYGKIECRYRVLGFRKLPGTNLASVKAVLDLRGTPAGGGEQQVILQTLGYASLTYEDGRWKAYATQLFSTPVIENFEAVSAEITNRGADAPWPPRLHFAVKR